MDEIRRRGSGSKKSRWEILLRLSNEEIDFIKSTIYKKLKGDIYIFGSRLDENVKGGDIDIYIIPETPLDVTSRENLKFDLKEILENELFIPVDIIISKDKNREIEKIAIQGQKIG